MVEVRFKRLLLYVAGLFLTIIMPAQVLPVLSPDKAIKTGSLPNGMTYYLVANSSIKGLADFALIQNTGMGNISDTSSFHSPVSIARDALSELSRCGGSSVQEFFTSHGVVPGKEGFVRVTDNATEFRFNDVLLSKPEVLDSALLMILDIVDRVSTTDDPFIRKWYAPSDQAIIISGDIDPVAVTEKLKMMSYMTPAVTSSERKEYIWEEYPVAEYVCRRDTIHDLASFNATWLSSRPPRETMNTVQPVIYEMFMTELCAISDEYIKEEFRSRNIPYADVSSIYKTSLQSSGDESFSVRVSVSEEDFVEAVDVVAEVMSRIDSGFTSTEDLARIKRVSLDYIWEESLNTVHSNSDYVDRCIMSFIYNGSLSTLKTRVDVLDGRQLTDSTELRLFNSISSALLDAEKNLKVSYSAEMHEDTVRRIFLSSWEKEKAHVEESDSYTLDDIPSYDNKGPRMKIKTEKSDHISNGLEWTFSNGFKVVYRKMDTGGRLYYTLALNGGFGFIGDLKKGEGGYVSDYFLLSKIYGVPAEEFIKIIESEGMSLDVYTGLNNTMISGSLDDDDTDLMMNVLLAVMNGREQDEDAVRYYESGEPLRHEMRKGTMAEMVVKVNEIMCPDYRYISHKMSRELSPEFSRQADDLFKDISAKTNDGVLILLGNMDETELKRKLLSYVGGFRTTDRAFRRPYVRYQPSSGWSTYTVEGDRNSVDIALSLPLALTADNVMTAEIAAMVLKKHLSDAIIDTGMYLELSHECKVYPSERLEFHISLKEASPHGFSSDVDHTGPMEAMAIVRSVLSGVSGQEVNDEEVDTFKAQLNSRISQDMKEPFYWLNVISRRHLAGKDFTTNYQARIKDVNAGKVKDILSRLNDGTRVEYIVSKE